jgi:mono/diheme cytochrome c family protein
MRLFLGIACLLVSAFAIISPAALSAQEAGAATAPKHEAARPVLNEQQKRGEALFVQNCPLCHIPSGQKKKLGIQGPSLQGMFNEDSDGDALKQFIQNGVPSKMPGFRYDLDQKQMDDLIAFLKSGAYLKTPGVAN